MSEEIITFSRLAKSQPLEKSAFRIWKALLFLSAGTLQVPTVFSFVDVVANNLLLTHTIALTSLDMAYIFSYEQRGKSMLSL